LGDDLGRNGLEPILDVFHKAKLGSLVPSAPGAKRLIGWKRPTHLPSQQINEINAVVLADISPNAGSRKDVLFQNQPVNIFLRGFLYTPSHYSPQAHFE
jgi:hypothetical protein